MFLLIGLLIPANNTIFIKSISEKLAANEPHLTLEFLEECIQGKQIKKISAADRLLIISFCYRVPPIQHRAETLVSGIYDALAQQFASILQADRRRCEKAESVGYSGSISDDDD